MTATETIVVARAKAFSTEGIREHKFLVGQDSVRVWDSVAGYYTTCHSLTAAAVRRIRRLARA